MTQKIELPAQLKYYVDKMLDKASHQNERLNYFYIVEQVRDELNAAINVYQRDTMQEFTKNNDSFKKRNK